MYWFKLSTLLVLFMIGYEVLCQVYPWSIEGIGQNFQTINQIKIENILEKSSECKRIFIGTSISHSQSPIHPPTSCDMALIGGDILTQLEWLEKEKIDIKEIYIEGNAYFRENLDLKIQFSYFSKNKILSLKTSYQLPNLILATLYHFVRPKPLEMVSEEKRKAQSNSLKQFQHSFNTSPIHQRVQKLIEIAHSLKKRGIKTHFYFLPLEITANAPHYHEALIDFKKTIQKADLLLNDEYQSTFFTLDGLHPPSQVLKTYFNWLIENELKNQQGHQKVSYKAQAIHD